MRSIKLVRNSVSWATTTVLATILATILATGLLVASLMLWDVTRSAVLRDPLRAQRYDPPPPPEASEVRVEVGQALPPIPGPAPDPRPSNASCLPFDELFERLVALYLAGMQADDRQDTEGVRAIAEAATSLQADLIRHADAGPKALQITQSLPPSAGATPALPDVRVRHGVATQLLTGALALNRKKVLGGSAQSRRDNDDLVHEILADIPTGPGSAALAASLLVGQPYLRPCHEGQVFSLAEVALGHPPLRDLASSLLYTLWDNIRKAGDSPGDLLDSVVLAHRTSALPSTRVAAWRYLLRHGNHAIRDLVLQQILDQRDLASMRILGLSVVASLAPRESLTILKQLAPVCSGHLTSAYLNLGYKDRSLIRTEYLQCLASQTHPKHRAQLVNASVFMGSELAELALQHDQATQVRANALLIVSGHSSPATCEAALHRALDSKSLGESPRVSIVVTALMAMARRGTDPNRVARVLQRLEANPHLGSGDLARLDQVRKQYLPR